MQCMNWKSLSPKQPCAASLVPCGKRCINGGRLEQKIETKTTITHQNLTITSSRQNKNGSSRRTPTATSAKRNSAGSTPLVTSANTPLTASATPVQQASHVDQIFDLNKNNKNNKIINLMKIMYH